MFAQKMMMMKAASPVNVVVAYGHVDGWIDAWKRRGENAKAGGPCINLHRSS